LIHVVHSHGVAFGNLSPFGRLWSILLNSGSFKICALLTETTVQLSEFEIEVYALHWNDSNEDFSSEWLLRSSDSQVFPTGLASTASLQKSFSCYRRDSGGNDA